VGLLLWPTFSAGWVGHDAGMGLDGAAPVPRRRVRWSLAAGLVVLSPVCAEYLAAYDVSTGDPLALLGGLLILGPLYGCPALLIREAAHRFGIGWPGILALAAAAGILEAGVFDQSLFSTSYRDIEDWDELLLPTFVDPPGVGVYLAMVFIVGHVVWSFGAPIAIVEGIGGAAAARSPWLRRPGLVIVTLLYAAAAALILGDHLANESDHASAAQVIGTLVVVAALVAAALTFGRRREPRRRELRLPPPRAVLLVSLVAAIGFQLVPPTWLGVVLAGAVLAVAAAACTLGSRSPRWDRRYVVAVAGGAVLALAVLSFFTAPLFDVPEVRKYAHNTVLLLGSLALIAWAMRRSGRAS
jgi:hypothetical protein